MGFFFVSMVVQFRFIGYRPPVKTTVTLMCLKGKAYEWSLIRVKISGNGKGEYVICSIPVMQVNMSLKRKKRVNYWSLF
jgi:hypothetical protein